MAAYFLDLAVVHPRGVCGLDVGLEVSQRGLLDALRGSLCRAGPQINEFKQAIVKILKRFEVDPLPAFIKHFFLGQLQVFPVSGAIR